MNNQNQNLAHLAALKKQNQPFHALPAEQQAMLERTRNRLSSTNSELRVMALLAFSQADLSARVADFLESLPDEVKQSSEGDLSREILQGLYGALHGMAAQLERIEFSLFDAQQELPDLCGERMAEHQIKLEQEGGEV